MRYLILSLGCLILWGCAKIEEPQTLSSNEVQLPDQEIWDGKIEITKNTQLQSVVQAGHIQMFEKQKLTRLDQGVQIDFYDKQGRHTSVLTSERARVEEKIDLFLAEDNVVVVSDSGAVLRTERLYWDRNGQQIRSDTLVVLTTELDSLRGYDFEANEDLTSWKLKNPTGQTFRRRQ